MRFLQVRLHKLFMLLTTGESGVSERNPQINEMPKPGRSDPAGILHILLDGLMHRAQKVPRATTRVS